MAIAKIIYKENASATPEVWMDTTQKTVTSGSMLSGTTALKNDGTDITGSIASKTSSNLTASGATVTAPAGYYVSDASKSVSTATQATPSISVNSTTGLITASATQTAGYVSAGTKSATEQLSTQAGTTISPTESEQTAVSAGKYTLGAVKVGAISSTYVGSGIDQNDSDDLTVSGATVTAPAGYYAEAANKSVASGSASTPSTSITANPTISVSSGGLITATASASQSVTPTVSAGYVSSGTAGTVSVSGSNTEQLSTQAAATITPTTSSQTAVAAGKYTIGAVTVTAIPSEYIVPSGTASLLTDGIHSVGAYAYANVDVADAISIQSTNIRISNHTLVIGIDVDYISASYVQTKIIYDSGISDLDDLRSDLTVTAYYNNTSEVVTDYTLFGTLNAGAQTIVVLYGNKIATFTTNVIAAKMSLSYTNGDLIKYGASISWDSTRHLFYTPSDAYRRRMFVVDYGVRSIKYNDGSTLSDSDFYPIPIPPNATEVTVSITPSTQYFGMPFYNLVNGEYERVQTFGWSQGSNTAQFEAGAYGFMSITTKYDSAGTTYPTEPTEFSIIFAE